MAEVCAVILARGGSKRLPGKNLARLGGKPLIAHTILAARKSKYIRRVVCSTDSRKIAQVAARYGADVPFLRPKWLASDTASSVDALLHALDYLRDQEGYSPDVVMLLQPTSPLRTHVHIDRAIRCLHAMKAKSLVTVKPGPHHESYVATGAIYLSSPRLLRRHKTFWTSKTIPYVLDGPAAIDIDTRRDLALARRHLRRTCRTR